MGQDGKGATRVTLTVKRDEKRRLEQLAAANDVSVSWLLRRGVGMVLDAASKGESLTGGMIDVSRR